MDTILIRLLSCLSRATLDPALGGRGMALSRILSLAAFGLVKEDEDALKNLQAIVVKIESALGTPRQLTHEEWNELQASAETGHWFLRASFPQVSAAGVVQGGYQAPPPPPPEFDPQTAIAEKPGQPAEHSAS